MTHLPYDTLAPRTAKRLGPQPGAGPRSPLAPRFMQVMRHAGRPARVTGPMPSVFWLVRPHEFACAVHLAAAAHSRIALGGAIYHTLFHIHDGAVAALVGDAPEGGLVRAGQSLVVPAGATVQFEPEATTAITAVQFHARWFTSLAATGPVALQGGRVLADGGITAAIGDLEREHTAPRIGAQSAIKSLFIRLGILVLRLDSEPPALRKPCGVRFDRVTHYVEANLAQPITIEDLAAAACLSPSHFTRFFKRETGMTPHQWVMRQRVGRAKRLLAEGVLALTEVAHACGFASQSHMSDVFRRLEGLPPGEWQRQERAASGA